MNLSNKYSLSRAAKSIILCIMAFIFISCPTFKRNPNLRLLLKEEGYSLLNPRWTKNGWIYYTKCDETGAYVEYGVGEIWRINDNVMNNELVLSNTFSTIDVSPSETLLVGVVSETPSLSGALILYNLVAASVETLSSNVNPEVGIKFGSADAFLYYYSSNDNGLHRINLNTADDTIIVADNVAYFDVYRDSLLIYNRYIIDISNRDTLFEIPVGGVFLPQYPDSLLNMRERYGLQIYDIENSEEYELDASIAEVTVWAKFGNWLGFNKSGQKIVFGATADVSESGDAGPFELWILEEF